MGNSIIEIPKPIDKFLGKFSNIFDKRFFNFKIYVTELFWEFMKMSNNIWQAKQNGTVKNLIIEEQKYFNLTAQ